MKTKIYLVLASLLFLFSCTEDFIGDGTGIKRVVICYYDAELGDYNTLTVTVEEAELLISYGAYLGVCDDEEIVSRTFVPDDAFEQELIRLGYDDVLDDYVLTENINDITLLELRNLGIKDLTGIEDFSSLKKLYLSGNLLVSLVVTNNSLLEILDVQNNLLEALDISQNINLIDFRCTGNNIMSLDVSKNLKLETLRVEGNRISSLEVSNLELLKNLWISNNEISEINVGENPALIEFVATTNPITNLDVTNNPLLQRFEFTRTQVSNIDLSNNPDLVILRCWQSQLESLDLSTNSNLVTLNCRQNPNLVFLDLKNGNNVNMTTTKIEFNPLLSCIQVDDVAYAEANWTKDASATFSEDCTGS